MAFLLPYQEQLKGVCAAKLLRTLLREVGGDSLSEITINKYFYRKSTPSIAVSRGATRDTQKMGM